MRPNRPDSTAPSRPGNADEEKDRWAIGIYRGPSPLRLGADPSIPNPALTYRDVTDREARFVADPFLIQENGLWRLFFEILGDRDDKGVIGLAESQNGLHWRYRQVVLEEPFHLSYPTVFESEGRHYMVPETIAPKTIRLYGAVEFPTRWTLLDTLVDRDVSDPSIFSHEGRWYILACQRPGNNDTLCLFHADRLEGPWKEHPRSPVVRGDPHGARPGGRVVHWEGRLFRFAQDCDPFYGLRVWAFEITCLDETAYRERPCEGGPVLDAGNQSWNRARMHHVDPVPTGSGLWIAAVDGCN